MAGEPALDKVLTALLAVVSAVPSIATADIDRASDDDYGNAELPAVNIVHVDTAFALIETGTTLHTAGIDLDMIVDTAAAATIGARLRILEADLVAALWANRTLGGLAQDTRLTTAGGQRDIECNEGSRILSIEVLYLTPLGDHRTVIGASGLVP